jgi:nucleoside-diphosphate-sugar epimerase
MRVLITGAAGGIGSRLSRRLADEGHDLLLIDDLSSGFVENLGSLQDLLFISDVNNLDLLQLYERTPPEVVIHLAGKSSLAECEENPVQAFRSNFLSTVAIAEYSRLIGAHLIFSSTSAVYEGVEASPLSEELQTQPHLAYPLSKKTAELYLESLARKNSYYSTVFRFFNVFGESQNIHRRQPPFANYLFREFSCGKSPTVFAPLSQSRDYLYVEDVIDLLVLAINRGMPKSFDVYNVCSGSVISVEQIVHAVAQGMGLNDFVVNQGNPEEYWASFESLGSGPFPLKKEIVSAEVHKHSLGDNSKAQEAYGWRPRRNVLEAIRNYSARLGKH